MVAVDVIGVLQQVAGEDRDDVVGWPDHARGGELPDARQGGRRGGLAADAAEADLGFGVGDFLLAHLLDHAAREAHFVQRFGPGDGVANANGRGQRFGPGHRAEGGLAGGACEFIERRGAFSLHDGQARASGNQPLGHHLAQGFAKRRGIAEIAAGKDHPIRRVPVALVHHLDHDGFLSLNTEGVDGV